LDSASANIKKPDQNNIYTSNIWENVQKNAYLRSVCMALKTTGSDKKIGTCIASIYDGYHPRGGIKTPLPAPLP
jgi:hypothetical protein